MSFATAFFSRVHVLEPLHYSQRYYCSNFISGLVGGYAEGNVQLTRHAAKIAITVSPSWMVDPPHVQCMERWMRRNVDWHAYPDGGLCYIHPEEWRDSINVIRSILAASEVLDGAASLCTSLSIQLIERHSLGHFRKMKTWPSSWEAYSHGKVGTAEYQKNKHLRMYELEKACQRRLKGMRE